MVDEEKEMEKLKVKELNLNELFEIEKLNINKITELINNNKEFKTTMDIMGIILKEIIIEFKNYHKMICEINNLFDWEKELNLDLNDKEWEILENNLIDMKILYYEGEPGVMVTQFSIDIKECEKWDKKFKQLYNQNDRCNNNNKNNCCNDNNNNFNLKEIYS